MRKKKRKSKFRRILEGIGDFLFNPNYGDIIREKIRKVNQGTKFRKKKKKHYSRKSSKITIIFHR